MKDYRGLAFDILFTIISIITVLMFYRRIIVTFIILVVISVVGLIKWKSKATLLVYVISAICGPVSEILAIHFGVWSYSYSTMLGIPIWLIPLWGATAAYIYQLGIEIKKLKLARK